MQIRTDLALESLNMVQGGNLQGIISYERKNRDCRGDIIEIVSQEGSEIIGKPRGKYITLTMERFPDISELCDGRLNMLCSFLEELIPDKGDILVAGLGNPAITPDAVGPECAKGILATRHIEKAAARALKLPEMRNVSVISPGVTGKTGIETREIIAGITEKIKPSAVIIIDALAAGSVKRLARTVQLSDTGISPGSGVGNARKAIDRKLLGVPVIAVGVPTVVDALSLSAEITGCSAREDMESYKDMIVAPKDTDVIISGASRLISLALNCVLQKNLSKEEIISLTLP